MLWIGDTAFPSATLAVNLIGSFLLGFYLARRERAVSARYSLQFWGIGALGSFTTFSTFSVDLVWMLEAGRVTTAALYVVTSVAGGLLSAIMGLRVGAVLR